MGGWKQTEPRAEALSRRQSSLVHGTGTTCACKGVVHAATMGNAIGYAMTSHRVRSCANPRMLSRVTAGGFGTQIPTRIYNAYYVSIPRVITHHTTPRRIPHTTPHPRLRAPHRRTPLVIARAIAPAPSCARARPLAPQAPPASRLLPLKPCTPAHHTTPRRPREARWKGLRMGLRHMRPCTLSGG